MASKKEILEALENSFSSIPDLLELAGRENDAKLIRKTKEKYIITQSLTDELIFRGAVAKGESALCIFLGIEMSEFKALRNQ